MSMTFYPRLMIDLKTTTAFKMAYIPLKIGCEAATGKEAYNLDRLCYLIGQYFQIKGLIFPEVPRTSRQALAFALNLSRFPS